MSIRRIIKSRIDSHVRESIANAETDKAKSLESFLRADECKDILKQLNKRR